MQSILAIRVQKLFLITIILKVGSSFLGWWLQDPWILGFTVPLAIMGVYIMLGIYRHDTEVTDEKFADTCYYVGFIFTITSIIFSLFDLPNIGTKIQDIAVRFGAAMVSTVAGLGVRVYLVSFKRDVADAIKGAEDAVIEASHKFREQLVIAYEKLRDFQSEVDTASKATIERVNMQVEALSKNHANKLAGFFTDLTERNQAAFTEALGEVKSASLRLSDSVDGYSQGMRANLTSIESKVTAFTEAVTERLKTTTFPDDYFAKNLAAPLAQLTNSASAISGGVTMAAAEVSESSVVLSSALKTLRAKATSTETSLERVLSLTAQQQAVLETAEGQISVLSQLTATLVKFDTALTDTLAGISASNAATGTLTSKVEAVVSEGAQARKSLETSLDALVGKLGANASATEALTGKLDDVAAADVEAAKTLGELGQHASTAIGKVDDAAQQLQGMVRQLSALDVALRSQSTELHQVAERIKDVKVTVELPAHANGVAPQGAHVLGHPAISAEGLISTGSAGTLATWAVTGSPAAPNGWLSPQPSPASVDMDVPQQRFFGQPNLPPPFSDTPQSLTHEVSNPAQGALDARHNGSTQPAQPTVAAQAFPSTQTAHPASHLHASYSAFPAAASGANPQSAPHTSANQPPAAPPTAGI